MEGSRSSFKTLIGQSKEKRPLGKSGINVRGNIRMDLKKIDDNTRD